ncbi:MAG TPA: heterodisulfide reductase-related iron-sulfur binding cluster [Candidatus Methylomirabilis sp.]|nr:heterodisulfide reductase-related iron-sulfur binding cluster [Candidatus Methylomirabilis sp.]
MSFDYGKYFGEITLTHDLLTKKTERSWLLEPPRDGERHDVVLYLGCNVLRTSHMVQTATAILDRLGLDYVAAGGPTYCCGIQHHRRGQTASSERYANHTVELLQKMAPREVIMWCPSCIQFYDEVLQADLPFPKRHMAEFLVERLERGEFTFDQRVDATVALHYHRASPPRQREGLAGRRLLEAVPGITVVEFEPDLRWGRSCTPALQEELGLDAWRQMALDDVDRALAAGATHLAGIYHGCHRELCRFEAERPIVVEHYLTPFARALGIEFEDTYKKYVGWGDPARILEDATPCMAANGVDPDRARALVIKTFAAKP